MVHLKLSLLKNRDVIFFKSFQNWKYWLKDDISYDNFKCTIFLKKKRMMMLQKDAFTVVKIADSLLIFIYHKPTSLFTIEAACSTVAFSRNNI